MIVIHIPSVLAIQVNVHAIIMILVAQESVTLIPPVIVTQVYALVTGK